MIKDETSVYLIFNKRRKTDTKIHLARGQAKRLLVQVCQDNGISFGVGSIDKEAPLESHVEVYSTPYWIFKSEEDANLALLLTDDYFVKAKPVWEITSFR